MQDLISRIAESIDVSMTFALYVGVIVALVFALLIATIRQPYGLTSWTSTKVGHRPVNTFGLHWRAPDENRFG